MAFEQKSRPFRLNTARQLIVVEQALSEIIAQLNGTYEGSNEELAPLLEARGQVATVLAQLLAPAS